MAFKTGGRQCKFESLENRQMMAGDVVGSVQAGTLTLKGDNFNNAITITPGVVPNSVVVTGFTPVGGNPTVVNGLANTPVTFLNITNGLKVKMAPGNDEVTVNNLNIFGKAKFDMGAGVDTLIITNSRFCKALDIEMGSDADHLTIFNTKVDGIADIDTGRGCDDVTITDSIFGELDVNLGADNDSLAIAGTSVITVTTLNGGEGINTFDEGISNFFGGFYFKTNLSG
jgi:hypothetical protein